MSKQNSINCPVDHPAIVAIAVDITLEPSNRRFYSTLVLGMADVVVERIRQRLTASENSDLTGALPTTALPSHAASLGPAIAVPEPLR